MVVLSAVLDDEDLVELLRLGVMGIMGKEASPEALVDCVRRVHEGSKAIDRDIAAGASDRLLRRESAEREIAATLTLREIEIVRHVAEGLRNREIAGRLSISEGTVRSTSTTFTKNLAWTPASASCCTRRRRVCSEPANAGGRRVRPGI